MNRVIAKSRNRRNGARRPAGVRAILRLPDYVISRLRDFAFVIFLALPLRAADAPAGQVPTGDAKGLEDVTITGESKDEVAVVKTPAPLGLPFRDVVALSRDGQRDSVLAEPVRHMTPEDGTNLLRFASRQGATPLMVRLPAPPFFRLEAPPGLAPFLWELQVVDQNNALVRTVPGSSIPTGTLEWDGYAEGVMKVLVGPAYSPVLVMTDNNGKKQRIFGDPVQMDALQYAQDGLRHVEFSNERLYERGRAEFTEDMYPLLEAAVDLMKRRAGTPFRVIVYADPDAAALPQKRLETWKEFLRRRLVIDDDDMTLVTMAPKERGRVTAVMMLEEP
jgi:hypothetical protein